MDGGRERITPMSNIPQQRSGRDDGGVKKKKKEKIGTKQKARRNTEKSKAGNWRKREQNMTQKVRRNTKNKNGEMFL